MKIRNCERCGKVFLPVAGRPYCGECAQAAQEEFERVRSYVRDNPNSDIFAVSKATGVPTERILRYVRDGRLEVAQGASWGLKCLLCGSPITIGRFCLQCAGGMQEEIREARKKPAISRFASEGEARSRFGR